MSSGGSGAPKNQTTTTSTIPKFAEPYAMQMLGQSSALTNINQNPYQSYTGQRVAAPTALQNQSYQAAGNMQTAPQLQLGSGIAGVAGLAGLGQNYQAMQAQNPYISQQYQGGANNFDQAAAQQYMSPYMQSVVDVQQQEALRQAGIAGNMRGAQAATSGAFGGSRHAIENAEANRNLATQLGAIQAQGLQSAFGQAQSQFNADQARLMQDQAQRNTFGLQNAQQMAQFGLEGNKLAEQSRQYGAGLGIQGLNTALQGANALGQMGEAGFAQQMGIANLQNQYGAQQQGMTQQDLTNQYQEFINRQNFPYQQLGFQSDLLHGLPTDQSSTIYQANNPTAQAVGLAGGLGSLYAANQASKNIGNG